jgi:hypothetical protein
MEMAQSTAVMLIITLVTLAFMLGIFSITQQSLTAETVKRSCQLSIQQKLFLDDTTGFLNPYEIECPRRIIAILDKQASILNSEELQKISKTSDYTYLKRKSVGAVPTKIDPENFSATLSEAVAYEMAECWDIFARGQKDPLDRATWAAIPADTCFICAEFHFQSTAPETLDIAEILQNTQHHLLDNTAKRYPTYDDFLYGAPSKADPQVCRENDYVGTEELPVGGDNAFAVVYYKHGFDPSEKVVTSCSAVAVTPISQLPKECFAII